MTDDASRKAILARRAKFVAAAIAGIGIACGKEPSKPQACLSVEPTTVPDAQPQPTSNADREAGIAPSVCLKVDLDSMDASPHPCLRMVPPKDKK